MNQVSSAAAALGDRLAQWAELASRWGFSDFLSPEDGFRNCVQSRQRWANRDQPGIYFWIAADGEAYVGQSIKPQSRLREHWRSHLDLERACFMPCSEADQRSWKALPLAEHQVGGGDVTGGAIRHDRPRRRAGAVPERRTSPGLRVATVRAPDPGAGEEVRQVSGDARR